MIYNFCIVLLIAAASNGQVSNGYRRVGIPSVDPLGSTIDTLNGQPNENLEPNDNLLPNLNNDQPPNDFQPPIDYEDNQGSSTQGPTNEQPPVRVPIEHDNDPTPDHKDAVCRQRFGYFRINLKCDSYIECRNYRSAVRMCPDGMNFNVNARWPEYPCGYPSDVPCIGRGSVQPPKPTAECPHQYGFFPLEGQSLSPFERCSRYLMCSEGKAVVMNCPLGLAFDQTARRCDWPFQVPSCKAFLGFTCPAPPAGDEYEHPEDLVQNYKYSANECSRFWSCEQGRARLLSCDYGLAFDSVSQRCVNEELVQCNHQEPPLLKPETEQPHFNAPLTH